jgi:prevent-host-death family protein
MWPWSAGRSRLAAFKEGCLALLDEVAAGGIELIVTKRGRPVARVVPIVEASERDAEILARLRAGTRTLVADDVLLRPSSDAAPWKALVKKGAARRSRRPGQGA